ncbi:unnamed protein product [Lupinus luteus]|uniref:Uncharacterized protein n=1 Tax=Lupinus luteus TaxID=3873 RepID=A0AAV1VXT2_LUPLU
MTEPWRRCRSKIWFDGALAHGGILRRDNSQRRRWWRRIQCRRGVRGDRRRKNRNSIYNSQKKKLLVSLISHEFCTQNPTNLRYLFVTVPESLTD